MTQLELRQDDIPLGPDVMSTPSPRRSVIARGLTVAAIVLLGGFLFVQGRSLWTEWTNLKEQVNDVRANAVVGYPDIAPRITYAQGPENWYHHDGGETLLWASWEHQVGHRWFRFASGDIDKALLIRPSTEMISRPIDTPVVETGGGAIWRRIPSGAPVVGQIVGRQRCVYPVHVLSKVQVINDLVDDQPFLITINLMAPLKESVAIFEAKLNGRRVTMAPSGYFNSRRPLLFDRGTESLWIEEGDSLKSLAGKYKGRQLALVAKPTPVAWDSWLAENPGSRLVVGANRSQAIPLE